MAIHSQRHTLILLFFQASAAWAAPAPQLDDVNLDAAGAKEQGEKAVDQAVEIGGCVGLEGMSRNVSILSVSPLPFCPLKCLLNRG